jgi:hypothetical protein
MTAFPDRKSFGGQHAYFVSPWIRKTSEVQIVIVVFICC